MLSEVMLFPPIISKKKIRKITEIPLAVGMSRANIT